MEFVSVQWRQVIWMLKCNYYIFCGLHSMFVENVVEVLNFKFILPKFHFDRCIGGRQHHLNNVVYSKCKLNHTYVQLYCIYCICWTFCRGFDFGYFASSLLFVKLKPCKYCSETHSSQGFRMGMKKPPLFYSRVVFLSFVIPALFLSLF